MSLSVLLPAYKEAANIPYIIPRLHRALKNINIPYEILVLDTTEPMDNTAQLCSEYNITHCPRQGGNDYGNAIRTGFVTAQYDFIVVMDCDGSHDPEVIADFWGYKDKADLVIGSRYIKGGKTDNPPVLILMSWAVNLIFRIVLGIKVKDISNSFRMYKSSQVKNIQIECFNFDLVEEILIKLMLENKGLKIIETPIVFEKRNAGQSKRDLIKFIFSYISTLWKLWHIKNAYKKKGRVS